MKFKPLVLGTTSVVLSMLMAGCGSDEQVEKAEVIRPVEIYQVTSSSSQYSQNFPALVAPSDESDLSFRVSGELIQLNVLPGNEVKKGDIIAQIDPTDYKVIVNEAKASYDLAVKTFERQEKMLALDLTSQAEYDMAQAEQTLAKTRWETAKNNVKYTTLYAPFNGIVSQVYFENREVVNLSRPVVSLHAADGIDISFQLPESILSQVKGGGKAKQYQPQITFTSSPKHKGQVYRASFKEMDQTPDPKSRSYKVVLTMPRPSGINVVPGMTASVNMELDQVLKGLTPYSLVPLEAVFSPSKTDPNDKIFAVWKIDQDTMRVHQQTVTIDGLTDQGVKVVSGLEAGDSIVAAGVHALLENTQVKEWKKQRGI